MQPHYLLSVKRACLVAITLGLLSWDATSNHANAIDINLTMEQAKQALSDGRGPMEKAEKVEDVANIMKAAEHAIRVGANPEEKPVRPPCHFANSILLARVFWSAGSC